MDVDYPCFDPPHILATDTGVNEMGRRLEKETWATDFSSVHLKRLVRYGNDLAVLIRLSDFCEDYDYIVN